VSLAAQLSSGAPAAGAFVQPRILAAAFRELAQVEGRRVGLLVERADLFVLLADLRHHAAQRRDEVLGIVGPLQQVGRARLLRDEAVRPRDPAAERGRRHQHHEDRPRLRSDEPDVGAALVREIGRVVDRLDDERRLPAFVRHGLEADHDAVPVDHVDRRAEGETLGRG
jgi:hypothetical protein